MIVAGELRRRLLRHGQPARKTCLPVRVADRDLRSGHDCRPRLLGKDRIDLDSRPAGRRAGCRSAARCIGCPRRPGSQRRAVAAPSARSGQILVEALRRTGRDVTRERLVDALEPCRFSHRPDTPGELLGHTRRIGSNGAWIVPPLAGGEPIWWDR